jgi:hypothetical protein
MIFFAARVALLCHRYGITETHAQVCAALIFGEGRT